MARAQNRLRSRGAQCGAQPGFVQNAAAKSFPVGMEHGEGGAWQSSSAFYIVVMGRVMVARFRSLTLAKIEPPRA